MSQNGSQGTLEKAQESTPIQQAPSDLPPRIQNVLDVLKMGDTYSANIYTVSGLTEKQPQDWVLKEQEPNRRLFGSDLTPAGLSRVSTDTHIALPEFKDDQPMRIQYEQDIQPRIALLASTLVPTDAQLTYNARSALGQRAKSFRSSILSATSEIFSGNPAHFAHTFEYQAKEGLLSDGHLTEETKIARDMGFYLTMATAVAHGQFEQALIFAQRAGEFKISGIDGKATPSEFATQKAYEMIQATLPTFPIETQLKLLKQLNAIPINPDRAETQLASLETSSKAILDRVRQTGFESALSRQHISNGLGIDATGDRMEDVIARTAKEISQKKFTEFDTEQTKLVDSQVAAEYGNPIVGGILAEMLSGPGTTESLSQIENPQNALELVSPGMSGMTLEQREATVNEITEQDSIEQFLNTLQDSSQLHSPRLLLTMIKTPARLEFALERVSPAVAQNAKEIISKIAPTIIAISHASNDRVTRRIISTALGLGDALEVDQGLREVQNTFITGTMPEFDSIRVGELVSMAHTLAKSAKERKQFLIDASRESAGLPAVTDLSTVDEAGSAVTQTRNPWAQLPTESSPKPKRQEVDFSDWF